MRLLVSHETRFKYKVPASGVTQVLRLTPSNHDSQYVVRWRVDVSADTRVDQHEDAFGNITHNVSADGPFDEFAVTVDGEVETQDTGGVVRGTVERFPPGLFLRETELTEAGPGIAAFAQAAWAAEKENVLKVLHGLAAGLHRDLTFDTDPTQTSTTANEAFALKRGVCQDLTHIFIAAARHLGIPARYVGGYFHRADGVVDQEAGHAWAEAHVPGLGWTGFDPTNGISTTGAHLRVAVGLDYLGASPIRGTRFGGAGEEMIVRVRVAQSMRQSQS